MDFNIIKIGKVYNYAYKVILLNSFIRIRILIN